MKMLFWRGNCGGGECLVYAAQMQVPLGKGDGDPGFPQLPLNFLVESAPYRKPVVEVQEIHSQLEVERAVSKPIEEAVMVRAYNFVSMIYLF